MRKESIRVTSGGGEKLEMTEAGQALHQTIVDRIARSNSQLFSGIEAADLAITRNVLVHVTERARSLGKR